MVLIDSDPRAPLPKRVDALFATLAAADTAGYIGEPVSQLAHALQAAHRAAAADDEALALAALLHDIGHFADPDAPQMQGLGAADHERIGRAVCDRLGFAPRVGRLVESHVAAKRYLARRAAYDGKLSEASRRTLTFQGGPMSDAEAAAFEADPDHKAMLRLRACDEAAKDPDAAVPGLDHWRPIVERHLQAQAIDAALAPPTDARIAAWRRDHLKAGRYNVGDPIR